MVIIHRDEISIFNREAYWQKRGESLNECRWEDTDAHAERRTPEKHYVAGKGLRVKK